MLVPLLFGDKLRYLEHVPPKCEAVWRDMLQHIDQVLVLFGGMIPSRRDAR